MARHRASRPNPAKVVGALLIALALLIGISIIPPQTARFPGLIAARLSQAVGRGPRGPEASAARSQRLASRRPRPPAGRRAPRSGPSPARSFAGSGRLLCLQAPG